MIYFREKFIRMRKVIIALVLFPGFIFSQFTRIPDSNFEQQLINLGYDDMLDGGVLTADIINVQQLNVSNSNISDITGIPRATVVRKLKKLIKKNYLSINNKKHYRLTNIIVRKLEPTQKIILSQLSDFSTRIYNLANL